MSVKSLAVTWCPSFIRPAFSRIERSPIGYRLARGMFWSMAGAVISRGLMMVASIAVARMLGKVGFGELGMIQSTVGMFGVLAGFGLGLTATKHVAEFRGSDPERAGRIIALSGVVALISGGLMALALLVFAPWLAERTIAAPHLAGVLRIGALILFVSALNGAQTGALSGFEAFKTIAHVNLYVGLISFPLLICGAYFGGLTGAVWALAVNLGFNWLFNHFALRKEARRFHVPFTFKDCRREMPILWTFSLPLVLGGAMVGPVRWICGAMLVNRPDGYGEMGIFTAALVVQNLLIFVSGMLNAPLLSMISNEGPNKSDKLEVVNILSTWLLGVIPAVPLLCFPEITLALFGAEYDSRSLALTFSLVVFYTTIMMFKAGLARVLAANNLQWWGFFSNAFWAIILVASARFLMRWGAPGLAASFAIAYIANTVILVPLYYSRNLVPKGTLLSPESALLWLILIVLLALNIAGAPLHIRAIAFVPSLLFCAVAFLSIANIISGVKRVTDCE
jgi:O-antigen/teichoic acid export membrane protein